MEPVLANQKVGEESGTELKGTLEDEVSVCLLMSKRLRFVDTSLICFFLFFRFGVAM